MTPSSATSNEAEIPFSRRGVLSFYASMFLRYRKWLGGLAVFMLLFALFSLMRLGAVGLILDAVEIHLRGGPPATVEAPVAGERDADGELTSPERDRNAVARFEMVWESVVPESYPPPTRGIADSGRFKTFLVVFCCSLAALSVGLGAAFFLKETIAISAVAHMLVDIRRALFDHLTRQSVSFFHERRAGDLISRVTNDVESTQNALHHTFQTILQQPVMILVGVVAAFIASPFLFMVAIPVLILMVVPVFRSGRRIVRHGRRRQQRLGVITEALQQLFGGIRIVKAFGMEHHERLVFQKKNRAFGRSFRKTLQAKITGRSLQEAFYNLGLAALLLLGAWLLTMKDETGRSFLSPGDFTMFILAMVQIYNPVKTTSKAWNKVQEARAGVERVLEILRKVPDLRDRKDARDFPGIRDEIRFERVGFSYRDALGAEPAPVGDGVVAVEGIDLRVSKGQVLALVGPSGSGKSTIVDLLARFYEPQEGSIRVDGVDVREYRQASYLENIAIVSQDPFLFNATIRENIGYGKEGAKEEEIVAAARAANAHDFILAQPEGYDTEIGERGIKLSGGQRQRLTIARALLKNAPILILDEATSALDSEAEKEVQKAIDNLMRERTTFVIAHRLSTIIGADRIAVLDDGRIVGQGTHDELMAEKGRYYELYTSQNPLESGWGDALSSPEAEARTRRS